MTWSPFCITPMFAVALVPVATSTPEIVWVVNVTPMLDCMPVSIAW